MSEQTNLGKPASAAEIDRAWQAVLNPCAPPAPSVTPEMVERALDAYDLNSIQGPSCPIAMRAALTAALGVE